MNFLQEENVGDTFNTFLNTNINSWLFLKGKGAKLVDVLIQNLTIDKINGLDYPPTGGVGTDEKVKCTTDDLTSDYLENKIISSDNSINLSTLGAGGTDQDFNMTFDASNVNINNLSGYPLNVDKGGTGLININSGSVPVGNGINPASRFINTPAQIVDEKIVTDKGIQKLTNKKLNDPSNNIRAGYLNNANDAPINIQGNVPSPGDTLVAVSDIQATWQNPSLLQTPQSRGNISFRQEINQFINDEKIIKPTIFNSAASKDFIIANSRLTYIGAGPKKFYVEGSIGVYKFIIDSPASDIFNLSITTNYHNFFILNSLRVDITNPSNLNVVYGNINGIIELTSGDEVVLVGKVQQLGDFGNVGVSGQITLYSLGF